MNQPRIAFIIPCYNEAVTIGAMVKQCQQTLPNAAIYVCDNNSTDDTASIAHKAGAEVLTETLQGKGNAVRRLLADVDADIYIMLDGDATYDMAAAPKLAEILQKERLDMLIGKRISQQEAAYKSVNKFGNEVIFPLVFRLFFGKGITDLFSGYRVMSRRFVKSLPVKSTGFEIETELTVHALRLRLPVREVETAYFARPPGSVSKLGAWKDGFKISVMMIRLLEAERPLTFYGLVAGFLGLLSIILAIPLLLEYMATGLVPRLPTAVLCATLMIMAFMATLSGIILHAVTHQRRELKYLTYLNAGQQNR